MSAPPQTKEIRRFKLLVVGVGGQGALTAARFLGEAALVSGLEVTVAQLHGMSQRGGAVECSVLIGKGLSSHIANGEADLVCALEPLEALRALPKMSERTKVVVNTGRIVPFSLAIQGLGYPDVKEILSQIREVTKNLYEVDGPALVRKVGVPRTLNVVMLGALAGLKMLPFDDAMLLAALKKKSPVQFLDANRLAFDLGKGAVSNGE
jgi:indolepyruvate ferredoxin oxidoreductase beta subunit